MEESSTTLISHFVVDSSSIENIGSLSHEIAEALCERANSLRNSHPSVTIGKDRKLIESLMDVVAAIRPEPIASCGMDDSQPSDEEISTSHPPMDCGGDPNCHVDGVSKKAFSKRKRMRKRIVQSFRRFKSLRRFTSTDRRGKEHKIRWSNVKTRVQPFYEERVQPIFVNWGEMGRKFAASVVQKKNWFGTASVNTSDASGKGPSTMPMEFETNDKLQ
ncbi:uncharacterized protein LOC118199285 [Stegodyphus dumicola]|uniref:uncharacterized protein LOC118199285 n=1 Tax=Stegodyphus dumicola TaxID=202533 RepID=UPI0015AAB7E6|nr:uncharacterized protein LOC118199285 [Stegodyphus dumicola]